METHQPIHTFSEGDIFYTYSDNKYSLYKLLKEEFDTYHVLAYEPVNRLPEKEHLNALDVFIHHVPIAKTGFLNPILLLNSKLTDDDLFGYHQYIVEIGDTNEIISRANSYYTKGYELTDQKNYQEAIKNYSLAINLIPSFYEAIDNRAFCKMDLKNWNEAIEDFRLSLSVNPVSFLAEFSIGECFLKSGNYKEAIKQFERAIAVDDTQEIATTFLKKAIALNNA